MDTPGRWHVAPCGPEAAEIVSWLTQAAFVEYASLDPPSGAGRESLAAVRADLEAQGGALAWWVGGTKADGRQWDGPVGCLRWEAAVDHLHVRRVAVLPDLQGRGIGRALMAWAEQEAVDRSLPAVTLGVRLALPRNLAFYNRLGYRIVSEHSHPGYDRPTWVEMRKMVRQAQR